MSDEPSTAKASEPTDVRFSVRSLFVLTAAVSIAAVVLGVYIRGLPPDAQTRVLIYWGALGVMLLGSLFYGARRRYRVEQRARTLMMRLAPHGYLLPNTPRLAWVSTALLQLPLVLVVWVGGSYRVANTSLDSRWSMAVTIAVYAGAAIAAGIVWHWWISRILFCERGLVVQQSLLPWEDCRRYYWDASYRHVIVLEWRKHNREAVSVPHDERAAVEALLHKMFSGEDQN